MKVLLFFLLTPYLLAAQTWDLAKDFNMEKNPNSPGLFGSNGYGVSPQVTPLQAAKDILGVPGLNGWADGEGDFPFVAKNTTNSTAGISGFEIPSGEVIVHPGSGSGNIVAVRWVAPTPGIFQVDAAFRCLHPSATAVPFVIKNAEGADKEILLAGPSIPAESAIELSEGKLALAAQDTLDFLVYSWQDGPLNDAVGLSVQIAPADPELLKPRLLLDYPFTTDTNDTSGKNLHGKVHGNPRFEVVEGRAGLVFDGTGDWVEVDAKLPTLNKEFTIECWVRPGTEQASHANIFGNQTSLGIGLELQQDAGNTNKYAFTYSTAAGGFISTKPIQLAAGRWQHVAITKSASEVKFYLNGILLDTVPTGAVTKVSPLNAQDAITTGLSGVPASALMKPSPLPMQVGLGFEDEVRCFNGMISGFRIWDRALSDIKPEVSPEQKLEALAYNSTVRLTTPSPTRIFCRDDPPLIEVSFEDKEGLGGVIATTFECVDLSGKTVAIAPGELTSKSGFKQTLSLTLPEGYYRLTCHPSTTGPAGVNAMQPASLGFAVLSDTAKNPAALPASTSAQFGSEPTSTLSLDGDAWKIATDPKNVGREEKWFNAPTADAKPTKVPWIIQDIFPDYHGVAWYWHDFEVLANPHDQGRTILRFLAVDYLAEVWVNGVKVGQHEGSEDPFEFDVTNVIKPNTKNRLAVRVLNPTKEGVDGILLEATARGYKNYPIEGSCTYNVGGIVDSVEILTAPVVRVENVFTKPNWKTGEIDLEVNVRNASEKPIKGSVRVSVAPASNGETLDAILLDPDLPPGDTLVRASLQVPQHRLWNLEDPFLYRVTVTASAEGSVSFDEKSTRCGFRDFRIENHAFRLNGKRIFLQGALILEHYPVGFNISPRPDYLRRDLVAAKAMGINTIRVIWGGLQARDLDVFDELGLLVIQEHQGSTWMAPSPELGRRFDASLSGVIRRDRNHPSIVMWGLLNESGIAGINQTGSAPILNGGPLFRHGAQSLPLVKYLDDTRLVNLNSGGHDMQLGQGTFSNPGAREWQFLMGNEAAGKPGYTNWWPDFGASMDNKSDIKADIHAYQMVPHTAVEIDRMRTLGVRANGRRIIITEVGTCCANNMPRFARHFEQMGAENAADAVYYRKNLDLFLADWEKWNLGRIWTSPEDYFTDSERNMVKLRRETGNALRANPHLAGYTFCALVDCDFNGSGLLNAFREFKPGVVDMQTDLTAPVRWCLFANPVSIYSGGKVKLEALLSNLDAIKAGDYPVRIEVVAPNGQRVFEENLSLSIPSAMASPEPPLVKEVFSREVPITGPTGAYKFKVSFERGAAASGGEISFHVFNTADLPPVGEEVTLWGKDDGLAKWLADNGIRTRAFAPGQPAQREVILVGNGGGDAASFRELADRMARGASVIFLSPSAFARGDKPLDFLPLATKGSLAGIDVVAGYFRSDTFAPQHPVFNGLPAGGVLDYTIYRNIIPQGGYGFAGLPAPDDSIVGCIRALYGYASVLQTAGYNFGAGRFILNTLRIRDNLGIDPVAERLLRNLLNHAAPDAAKPLAELPADFDQQLKAIGYE